MSSKAPRAEHRPRPRLAAAVVAALWLAACSGSDGSSEDPGSGGTAPVSGGAATATGSTSGRGGEASSGGTSGTGGSATGGTALGGASAGGAPSGGSAGSGGSPNSSGGSGAFPLGGSGGRSSGGTGGVPAVGGRGSSGAAGMAAGAGGLNGTSGKANGGASGSAGADAGGASGGSGGASSSCPLKGSITYTLARAPSPTAAQTAAYDKITAALDKALAYYNCYTDLTKELRVSYEPSVATADGNVNGSIRFGSQDSMNHITAMHEIGHTLGVGSSEWGRSLRDGIFTGETATAKLREIDRDPAAQVHGDAQHFWPYGLNYTSEVKSDADLLAHCALVMAIRADLYP